MLTGACRPRAAADWSRGSRSPGSCACAQRRVRRAQSASAAATSAAPRDHFASAATWTLTILSGFCTGSPFLILSTTSMPESTSPITVYWPFRLGAVGEHDEELAVGAVVAVALARHADNAALVGHVGELGLEVGIFRAAGAVAVLPVAGLRHEARDHAVERHAVVEVLARELLQPRGVARRDVVAQLDDDAALRGVDQQRVLRIGAGRQAWLGKSRARQAAAQPRGRSNGSCELPVLSRRLCRQISLSAGPRPAPARRR